MTRTRQEIFDLAWNGLKAQGFRRAYGGIGVGCLYRGPDGMKCAIGHCIADERYDPEMDMCGQRSLAFRAAGVASEDYDFAIELQTVHDCGRRPEAMEDNLRRFASRHSLTIPS